MSTARVDPARVPHLVALEVRHRMSVSGMTVSEMSATAGVPRTTLVRRLMGLGGGFKVDELADVAEALNTSVAALFTNIDVTARR